MGIFEVIKCGVEYGHNCNKVCKLKVEKERDEMEIRTMCSEINRKKIKKKGNRLNLRQKHFQNKNLLITHLTTILLIDGTCLTKESPKFSAEKQNRW